MVFVKAQSYKPLSIDGAHWIVIKDLNETIIPCDEMWEYYANGDTIIDNKNYIKIYKRDLIPDNCYPPFEADGIYELYGFIRDDTIEKKVYAIQLFDTESMCSVNEEYLMYDFSVDVGDTIDFCLLPDFGEYIIFSILQDNILGYQTRQFSTEFNQNNYFESIGSQFGLFESWFTPVKNNYKQELFVLSLEYYCRESPCDYLVSTSEYSDNKKLELYPNLTSHSFTITMPFGTGNTEISIFNIPGREIPKSAYAITKNHDEIEVKNLNMPKGIYLITTKTKNKQFTNKIIFN